MYLLCFFIRLFVILTNPDSRERRESRRSVSQFLFFIFVLTPRVFSPIQMPPTFTMREREREIGKIDKQVERLQSEQVHENATSR